MWRFSGLRCPLLRVAIFHDVIITSWKMATRSNGQLRPTIIGNRLQPACIVCFSGHLILSIALQSLVPQRGQMFQGAYGTCSTTIRPRTISKVLRSRAIWQPFSLIARLLPAAIFAFDWRCRASCHFRFHSTSILHSRM